MQLSTGRVSTTLQNIAEDTGSDHSIHLSSDTRSDHSILTFKIFFQPDSTHPLLCFFQHLLLVAGQLSVAACVAPVAFFPFPNASHLSGVDDVVLLQLNEVVPADGHAQQLAKCHRPMISSSAVRNHRPPPPLLWVLDGPRQDHATDPSQRICCAGRL